MPSCTENRELVRLLVGRQEVNPNALYGQGTALQWAVECDCEDMVELLLSDKQTNPDFYLFGEWRDTLTPNTD